MGFKKNDACLAKVKDDEPIFVLRAQDTTAPEVVEFWANILEAGTRGVGRSRPEKIKEARRIARDMRDWQSVNGSKLPD